MKSRANRPGDHVCQSAPLDTEEHARAFGDLVAIYVRSLSCYIALTALEGIKIAFDYAQALLDLDRGYDTKPIPNDQFADFFNTIRQ